MLVSKECGIRIEFEFHSHYATQKRSKLQITCSSSRTAIPNMPKVLSHVSMDWKRTFCGVASRLISLGDCALAE